MSKNAGNSHQLFYVFKWHHNFFCMWSATGPGFRSIIVGENIQANSKKNLSKNSNRLADRFKQH